MKQWQQAFDELQTRGITRWDTFPPTEGMIRWSNAAGEHMAEGKFKVILSCGPGDIYTMAYDISVYVEMGIPIVEKLDDGPSLVENISDENLIRQRADEVGKLAGADFTYQCGNLIVGVFDFKLLK